MITRIPRDTTGRVGVVLAAVAVACAALVAATGAHAAADGCPLGLTRSQTVTPTDGAAYIVCSGRLRSFDTTPLDTDVSIPVGVNGPLPLMVMLHGWGGSKTDLESTSPQGNGTNTWDWNNAWFASRGFAVLNYTARGFGRSCGQDPTHGYTYATDPACSGKASWTHLSDRRWEIRDTQYLTGLLVDAHVAVPDRVVVTGDSYGGGQSWLLAMAQDQVLQPDGTTRPWTSPRGVPIRLAAAVPHYPWTDLAQAMVDNGRASDGLPDGPADGPHEDPIGVAKQSYVTGLYTLGQSTAQYAVSDPSADLPGWFAAFNTGEPYETNPIVGQAIQQLQRFRSAYYLPVPAAPHQIPVFDIQGLTDPLFPGMQATQMLTKLQAAQPAYPAWAFFGDLGHSYADNPPATWQLANTAANTWLSQMLVGTQPTTARFSVSTVPCLAGQDTTVYPANTLAQLATGAWSFHDAANATTVNAPVAGPESAALDPIANHGCRTTHAGNDPGVAAWTFHPPTPATLLGAPHLHVTATPTGTNAELAARLFDLEPATGTQTLITRAVYRITGTPAQQQQINVELWPTAWQLLPGHQLTLELTQNDTPTWRADNQPAALTLTNLELTVPTRT